MLNRKGGMDFSLEGIFKLVLFTLALFLIIVVLPTFLTFWKGMMATQKVDDMAADITMFHQKGFSSELSSQNNLYNFPNVVSDVYIGMKDDGKEYVCATFYQDKLPWGDYCAPISSEDPTIMIGEIKDGDWTCDPLMVGVSLAMWFIPTTWITKPVVFGAKIVGKVIGVSSAIKVASVVAKGGSNFIGRLTPNIIKKLGTKIASTPAEAISKINNYIVNKVVVSGLKKNMAKAGYSQTGKSLYFKSGKELETIANNNAFQKIVNTIKRNAKGEKITAKIDGNYLTFETNEGVVQTIANYDLSSPTDFVKGMEALGIEMRGDAAIGKGIAGTAINGRKDGELIFRLEDNGFMEKGVFKHEGALLTGSALLPYKARRIFLPKYGAGGVVRMGVAGELYKFGSYDCGTVVNLSFHSCNIEESGKKLEADTIKYQSDFNLMDTLISTVSGCEPPKKVVTHDPCASGYSTYLAHQNAFIEQKFGKELDEAIKKVDTNNGNDDCTNYASMLFDPMAYNINCYCSDDFIAQITIEDKTTHKEKYKCKGVLDTDKGMDCVDVETNEILDGRCKGNVTNLSDCINDSSSNSNSCNLYDIFCNLTKQPGKDVRFEDKDKLINITDDSKTFYCDYSTDLDIITKLRELFGRSGYGTSTEKPYVEINCKTTTGGYVVKKIGWNNKVKEGDFDKKVFLLYDDSGKVAEELITTIIIRWNCEGNGQDVTLKNCYTCALAADGSGGHFENYTAIKTYIAGTSDGLPKNIEQKYICRSEKETESKAKESYIINTPANQPTTLECKFCQDIIFKGWDTGNLYLPLAEEIVYSDNSISTTDLTYSGTVTVIAPFVYDPSTAIECSDSNKCGGDFCEGGIEVSFNPCSKYNNDEISKCKEAIAEAMQKSQNLASQNYVVVKVDEVKQQQSLVGTFCSSEGI